MTTPPCDEEVPASTATRPERQQQAPLKHEDTAMADTGTRLWNIQKWDQTLGTYTNLEAAKAHGTHLVHDHYRHYMDRRQVPISHRAVDWRVHCCGHLYGPGQLDHTAYPDTHAEGCREPTSRLLLLRPFWAATGRAIGTGHVSTHWEIWEGRAYDQFDPSAMLA
jgi:hypothetical protein